MQKEHAILTADKAKNTYGIHCKKWLTEQVILETETTSMYKQALNPDGSPMQMMEIVDKDWQIIEEEGLAQKTEPEESDQTPIYKELLFHERVPTFEHGNVLLLISWTQIAKSLSPKRGS